MLAHVWKNNIDVQGWWISEKLDGVRCYWDGKQMWSRNGNLYYAPEWFTKDLPREPLDGELFLNRKSFQQTCSIVKKQYPHDGWKDIRYRVFDLPDRNIPFEQRQDILKTLISNCKYAELLPQIQCQGITHLIKELDKVEQLGGEGLMLRKPGSYYEIGRSHTLLKVKSFQDAEATVIGYEPGKGKHKGRIGALIVTAIGDINATFKIGTGLTDEERDSPPSIGSIITFRYQELSSGGVPRFPSFMRVI